MYISDESRARILKKNPHRSKSSLALNSQNFGWNFLIVHIPLYMSRDSNVKRLGFILDSSLMYGTFEDQDNYRISSVNVEFL